MNKSQMRNKRTRSDERKASAAKKKMGNLVFWTMLILFNIVATISIFSHPTATLYARGITNSEINSSQLLNVSATKMPFKFFEALLKMTLAPLNAMCTSVAERDPRPMLILPSNIFRAMLLIEPKKLPPLSPEVEVLISSESQPTK